MDVIRKGLRLGESASEERAVSVSDSRTSQVMRSLTSTSTSAAALQRRSLEPETTIKNKLVSAWNNVKYGKNAWLTSEMFKPGFSRNSPVWLLGQAYHRKLADETSPASSPSQGEAVRTFSESDSGIEAFQRDFQSRLWFTYRRDLAGLAGLSSDCGWGCMIRSGQMLVGQALSLHWLGRDWRLEAASEQWQSERLHRAIIQLFSDLPDSQLAPLSLQNLVMAGRGVGRSPGDWLGPHTVSHLLAAAAKAAQPGAGQGLLDSLAFYLAQDCTVYREEVEQLCLAPANSEPGVGEDFQQVDVDIDGQTWCLENQARPGHTWRSLVLLVPLRLGGESFNPIYNSCIKNLLTLDCCIGIIGGKPRHSLYFVGFQDDELIHLDPHRLQDRVDTTKTGFSTASYHCSSPRKINLSRIDPSCCVGFYLRDRSEFDAWCETITGLVTPPHISGVRPDYPMFVVSEGRSPETRGLADWVSLGPESSVSTSSSSHNNFETEEFVFL